MAMESNSYLNALRAKPKSINQVEIKFAESRVAMAKQDKRCARCKKDLRPNYYKTMVDPKTHERTVVCSDCLVNMAKR